MRKKQIVILGTLSFFSVPLVHAYLDPGTGGVIFNSIWPLIVVFLSVVGAFIVKWFWKPLKRSFSKLIPPTKRK